MGKLAAGLVAATLIIVAVPKAHADDFFSWEEGWDIKEPMGVSVLGRYRVPAIPLALVTDLDVDSDAETVWIRGEPGFGGRVVEFGPLILNRLTLGIINAGGSQSYRGEGYNNLGQSVQVWERNGAPNIAPSSGMQGYWSLDVSPDLFHLAAVVGAPVAQFHLGFWSFRGVETGKQSFQVEPTSKTARVLADHDARYVQNAAGFEMIVKLRKHFRIANLVKGEIAYDLPILYPFVAPFYDFAGYYGGFPRWSAGLGLELGPIETHVTGSIPTRFMVVPYPPDAAELLIEAGIRL